MSNRGIITSDGLAWVKIPAEVESLDILLAGDWHKGHACHADSLKAEQTKKDDTLKGVNARLKIVEAIVGE